MVDVTKGSCTFWFGAKLTVLLQAKTTERKRATSKRKEESCIASVYVEKSEKDDFVFIFVGCRKRISKELSFSVGVRGPDKNVALWLPKVILC